MPSNCDTRKDSWESLGQQGDQTSNPKGNQPWIFIGRTDAEAPILWPLDVKSQLTRKDPDDGKDWGQEEKRMTEDEMVWWIIDSVDVSLSELQEIVRKREAWSAAVHGVAESDMTEDWTTTSPLASELFTTVPIFKYLFRCIRCCI